MAIGDKKASVERMGRPPKAANDRRATTLTIRVTADEHRLLHREARKRNVTISEMLLGPWRKTMEK